MNQPPYLEWPVKVDRRSSAPTSKFQGLKNQVPAMVVATLYSPKPWCIPKIAATLSRFPSNSRFSTTLQVPHPPSTGAGPQSGKLAICDIIGNPQTKAALVGVGLYLTFVGPASSLQLPLEGYSLQLHEPPNALSLPTWAVHVSSVVEWIIAMALVWQYGEKSGYEAWKGLSWGMVPLLGGALCACTWHFFYNSESLEVLVALQAALTVTGNATMCLAAYRIYKSYHKGS